MRGRPRELSVSNWNAKHSVTQELRVPKVRKPVELLLDGGASVRGEVYLLPSADRGGRPERVLDLLRSSERFLPLACDDGRRLVNKRRIVSVRVADWVDAGLEQAGGPEEGTSRVMIDLSSVTPDNARVSGRMRWTTRRDRRRLVDHLNDVEQWIAVEDPEGPLLVACRYIVNLYS